MGGDPRATPRCIRDRTPSSICEAEGGSWVWILVGLDDRSEWLVESLFQAIAMAKRLYVGNLSYSVDSELLQEMFEQFGRVRSAQVLIDRETNRSRGFGFVEMEDDAEADAAIEALDGNDHEGRRLTVNEARPREPRTGGGGGYGGGGGRSGGYGGGGYGGGGYGSGGGY
jgi:hypothetical protein